MTSVSARRRSRFAPASQWFGAALLATLLVAPASCTGGDDDDTTAPAKCTSTGGPVEGDNGGLCVTTKGEPISQVVGKCQSVWPDATCVTPGAGGASGGAGAGSGGASAEEEEVIRYTSSAPDDDCKYDVSFTNSCVELNKPVTFTVTLKKRADDGAPATGAHPDSPEIFFESEPSHISPSLDIQAPESPPGTYKIGPIVFDRSGRWVVRFHFYESCIDLPEDSPHGHIAFYIDVP